MLLHAGDFGQTTPAIVNAAQARFGTVPTNPAIAAADNGFSTQSGAPIPISK